MFVIQIPTVLTLMIAICRSKTMFLSSHLKQRRFVLKFETGFQSQMCFLCGFVKAPSIMTLVRKLKCFYLETSLPWDTDKLDWTSGSCCRHTSQGKVKSKGPFWKNACQIRCSSSNRNTGMIFAALEKSYFFILFIQPIHKQFVIDRINKTELCGHKIG